MAAVAYWSQHFQLLRRQTTAAGRFVACWTSSTQEPNKCSQWVTPRTALWDHPWRWSTTRSYLHYCCVCEYTPTVRETVILWLLIRRSLYNLCSLFPFRNIIAGPYTQCIKSFLIRTEFLWLNICLFFKLSSLWIYCSSDGTIAILHKLGQYCDYTVNVVMPLTIIYLNLKH